jgi:hypothetical protein
MSAWLAGVWVKDPVTSTARTAFVGENNSRALPPGGPGGPAGPRGPCAPTTVWQQYWVLAHDRMAVQ